MTQSLVPRLAHFHCWHLQRFHPSLLTPCKVRQESQLCRIPRRRSGRRRSAVHALANDEMMTVGRFLREVARAGFSVARRFLLTSLPVAHSVHNSRAECSEVVSFTNYGLHTADFAASGSVLLQNYSRPGSRRTHDSCRDCHGCTATTIEELRSELLLRFWVFVVSAVEGKDTRLHEHTTSDQTTPPLAQNNHGAAVTNAIAHDEIALCDFSWVR